MVQVPVIFTAPDSFGLKSNEVVFSVVPPEEGLVTEKDCSVPLPTLTLIVPAPLASFVQYVTTILLTILMDFPSD